jgi:Cellulase (glycosyl hydrolase family 5)
MTISIRSLILLLVFIPFAPAHAASHIVVFSEPGFPAADSATPTQTQLQSAFAGASFTSADQLASALAIADLLVMPYGSAWPEAQWKPILEYLDRGGNLLVLGGKPFTRAAWHDASGWHLRASSVAASLELFIHDYQQTAGSDALKFQPNTDVFPALPEFSWKHAFSPVLRLSVVDKYHRDGSTGDEDFDLTTLAWGTRDGHKLAAPVFEIDHNQFRFVGGRWIFAACDFSDLFFSNTQLLGILVDLATRKADRFTFRPHVPLFLPGEPLDFVFEPYGAGSDWPAGGQLKIRVTSEDNAAPTDLTIPADFPQPITLPASAATGKGLHTVEATLLRDGKPLRVYRSGFWMRDWDYLLSGPKLTVGSDYFQLDGKPLPVVGTTYMSSDVARLYLSKPNAWVWDQDMAQIDGEGLNMIRSGLWTGWDPLIGPNGAMTEDALRTIEAFLMCARHNHLPVQFNLFAFLPENLGGENPYLDPVAWHAQAEYVTSIAQRFHAVPFLAWDLINEPSANANLWRTQPIGDAFEQAAWRRWLAARYPNQPTLLDAWAEPAYGIGRNLQLHPTTSGPETAAQDPFALPAPGAWGLDAVRSGYNPLKVYDYFLFTQSIFTDWVQRTRDLIRAQGSTQLITVGQEENGVSGRLSPAFYSQLVDFTADHTWWDFDAILWASLAAKFPGKPMLIQETGEQRRLLQDDHLRLTAEEEGWQLERKLAVALAQGAGALEWVWDVNSYMSNDNEIPIGAVRPDGTEKPEAQILSAFAAFVAKSPASFTHIQAPQVAMVTSQALLYSGMNSLALDTQKHALRALAYYDHTPFRFVAENRLAELGSPKVAILPAAQALSDEAWSALMKYVEAGGTLLVTGPVQRNEHWQFVDRLTPLGVKANLETLAVRQSDLQLENQPPIQISFPTEVQQLPIDVMRFADGKSVEVISHGSGHILWARDPVEFSEDYEPAAVLYRYALKFAGLSPALRELTPLSPAVLAFPTVLDDAVLYSFSNESLDDQPVAIEDAISHASIHFTLPAQRGAAILLRKSDGSVLAAYGEAAPRK